MAVNGLTARAVAGLSGEIKALRGDMSKFYEFQNQTWFFAPQEPMTKTLTSLAAIEKSIPGSLADDVSNEDPVLYRHWGGQRIPKRWQEYGIDSPVLNAAGDYFLSGLLYLIDNAAKSQADKILKDIDEKINRKYPISVLPELKMPAPIAARTVERLERERLMHEYDVPNIILAYMTHKLNYPELEIDALKDQIGPLLPRSFVRGAELARRGRDVPQALHEYIFERRILGD